MIMRASTMKAAVAPHAGAWIETSDGRPSDHATPSSPPTRGRGLKHVCDRRCTRTADRVAPHAGAWIETRIIDALARCDRIESPPTRGRGLKPLSCDVSRESRIGSPPTRGRGLKHVQRRRANVPSTESPPTRGRGLKPIGDRSVIATVAVAPHAGAWIETPRSSPHRT